MRKLSLFILFISMFGLPIWATDWWVTTVDTTYYNGVYGTSIALDTLGMPHIAYCRYAGGGLVYASFNPEDSTWSYELVFDSAGVGSKIAGNAPSLAFDSRGYPHISFWWGDLGYAWKDSLGWHTTYPYPGPWIQGTSIRLDKYDYPHIGYACDISRDSSVVMYTFLDEGGWHTEVIDTGGPIGMGFVSLTLDSAQHPHLSYGLGYPPQGLGYAKRGDEGWDIEVIDTSAWVGYTSIALDSLGRPHITYSDAYRDSTGEWTRDLKYAVRETTGWKMEKVDIGGGGDRNCLCLDENDSPHISYKGTDCWLKYAWKWDGVWHIEKIDSIMGEGGAEASYTGLVIDRDGRAHISYNVQFRVDTGYVINTKYATGYPEARIEIGSEDFDGILFKVYPTIGQRRVQIEYVLKGRNEVNLCIYNIVGQKVIELADEIKSPGRYTEYWDTQTIKSGIYFCCLRTGDESFITKKVIIIK